MNYNKIRQKNKLCHPKTTVNWLFYDIWWYLVIGCFNWKIFVFQDSCKCLLYPELVIDCWKCNNYCLKTVRVMFYLNKFNVNRKEWQNEKPASWHNFYQAEKTEENDVFPLVHRFKISFIFWKWWLRKLSNIVNFSLCYD